MSVVSQFIHTPYEEHMKVVNKILRYLKTALGKALMFRKTEKDHGGMGLDICEEIWLQKV